MENIDKILECYRQDHRTDKLCSHLDLVDSAKVQISGLIGASYALVGKVTSQKVGGVHLFIEDSKEAAAYLLNTLQNISEQDEILFLPDSFKRPGRYDDFNNHNVQLRTETIAQIAEGKIKNQIVVSYPEAILEKTPSPKVLLQDKIIIKKDEALDTELIFELLIDMAFERTDFVYEPGQFSVRGGIVDIFSHGNEWPYRIELFDDEVESIREFDPLTQLSKRNLAFLSIVPNVRRVGRQIEKVSLFDILPEDTVLWIDNMEILLDQVDKANKDFIKAKELAIVHTDDEELVESYKDFSSISAPELEESLSRSAVCIHGAPHTMNLTEQIAYSIRPHTSFNKNIRLLIEEMKDHQSKGIENYLFTDNPRQVERFHNIFTDLEASVSFQPVMKAIHAGFVDEENRIACYTDHQIFKRFHKYKLRRGYTRNQALQVKMLRELKPGDYVTHIDHGIGRYSGLEKITINDKTQESVRLMYKNNDILYVGINSLHKISKYTGQEGTKPALHKIGGDAWKTLKRKTKKKVKDIAKDLIKLYAKRKASEGYAFGPDGYMQNELEASFMYEDTPDQFKTTAEVKEDMMKPHPMDRLVCGDVGFGKTEIAVRAAFKAVVHGKQVAILVPTTILALQHYKTFKERLNEFAVKVDYINRFRSSAEKRVIYEKLQSGEIDLIIGTHALLNKKVKFKDLGLLVIDEEQKFGVAAKEKLRNMKVNVDTLTLTATPIPRTLQFSLMSARDLSILKTAPPNRQPIHTERRVFNDELIADAIMYEYMRGGQVFFVHNRVKSLADMAALVQRTCPDVKVSIAHGQMEVRKLESTLLDFIEGNIDVLVCTNIIETGLDISNANTIIINNAHQYGLSDLHQLRGRVGRSNRKAYCYLFSPPLSVLTPEARKRIKTIEDFSDLGSGFHIAMRDLDIRGAGNLLGGEQSGFISDIGYETYQKILNEAILELKTNEFDTVFEVEGEEKVYVQEVDVETDHELLIPDDYVNVIQERLYLYSELNKIEKEEELQEFKKNLKDRFGPIPDEVNNLFTVLRVKWIAKKIGFERVFIKRDRLKGIFLRNPKSKFYESTFFQTLMQNIATQKISGWSIKQTPKSLSLSSTSVTSLEQALERLIDLHESALHQTT